jgi:lipopolysaccharide export system protein LptA
MKKVMNKAMLSGNTAVKQGCTHSTTSEAQSVFAQKEKHNKKENKE